MILAENVLICEKPKHILIYLILLRRFAVQPFLLFFMASDKNWPFLILYEKYQMFSGTNCLIRNSDTPYPWLWSWLICGDSCESWPGSWLQIWEFFPYQNGVWLLSSCNLISIGYNQLFSNPLHCPQIDT